MTSQLGKFEMEATLREAKLPCAAVYTVPDAMASEHIAVREMLVEVEDDGAGKVTIPGTTVKLMRTPGIIKKGAPLLGGDTHDVLSGLGYDEDKLQQLKADGVICEA